MEKEVLTTDNAIGGVKLDVKGVAFKLAAALVKNERRILWRLKILVAATACEDMNVVAIQQPVD